MNEFNTNIDEMPRDGSLMYLRLKGDGDHISVGYVCVEPSGEYVDVFSTIGSVYAFPGTKQYSMSTKCTFDDVCGFVTMRALKVSLNFDYILSKDRVTADA